MDYTPSPEYQEFVVEQSFPQYLAATDSFEIGLSLVVSRAVLGLAAEFEEFTNVPYDAEESALVSEMGDVLFWYANIYYLINQVVADGESCGKVFAEPEEDIHAEVYQSLFGFTEKLTRKASQESFLKYAKPILYLATNLVEEAYENYSVDCDAPLTLSELEASNRAKLEQRVQKQGSPV